MGDALSRWCDLLARAPDMLTRANEQDYTAVLRGEFVVQLVPFDTDDSYCRVEEWLARQLKRIAAHRFQQAASELRRDAVAEFLAPKLDESRALLDQLLELVEKHFVLRDGSIASAYYECNGKSAHVLRCVTYLKIERRLKETTQQLAAWCPSPIEAGNAAQGDDEAETPVSHSVDFRSVLWFGTSYSFTANQAPVVRLLHEHWQAGTPDVGDETLLLSVDPEAPPPRLSNLFRGHPAWGTMILAGGSKGTHRLARPKLIT